MTSFDALDNPIWESLTSAHANMAWSNGSAHRYANQVSPLAAVSKPTPTTFFDLAGLVQPEEHVGLFTADPLQVADDWEMEPIRAFFWRSHFEVWELSGLTLREYCERHGLSLKNFGNWRGQLKREGAPGPKSRWGRYPRLRLGDSHMANPTANATLQRAHSPRARSAAASSAR